MTTPTSPESSPLDTLKHTALSTIDLIELVQDRIGGDMGDADDWIELLDVAVSRLLSGLAEHVDGVDPSGIGRPGWFPTLAVRQGVSTYDDGGRVVVNLEGADGVIHVRYPRIPRPAAEVSP
jgi:hypothetical protein